MIKKVSANFAIVIFTLCLLFSYTIAKGSYDSTYVLAITQKFAIPENVQNGDYVGHWQKTLTWNSDGTITYSISTNFRNAFSIDPVSGLITVSDKNQINNMIQSQDTVINLIIRTKDSKLGFELDTAQIRVKGTKYCKFIDYSYSGIESGTRSQPYNDLDDISFTVGYGYFIKRGNKIIGETTSVNSAIASDIHPIILGAYGPGEKPELIGTNQTTPQTFYFGTDGGDPDATRVDNFYIYDLVMRDYLWPAINWKRKSKNCGVYNCEFYNNDREYHESQIVLSTSTSVDTSLIKPFEFINCVWDTTNSDSHIKIGAMGPVKILNCRFGNATSAAIRIGGGSGPERSQVKHCLIETNSTKIAAWNNAIQVGGDYITIEDCKIIGSYTAIRITSGTNEVPRYPAFVIIRNCYLNSPMVYGIHVSPPTYEFEASYGNIYEDNLIVNSAIGIYENRGQSTIIRRNEIHDMSDFGIEFNGDYSDGKDGEIYLNILYNTPECIRIYNGTGYLVYNNTIDGIIDLSGSDNSKVINNYYKKLSGASVARKNIDIDTINKDLHFLDYEDHFYKLKSTAYSAIDKAEEVDLYYDFENSPIIDNAPDIGAYEYHDEGEYEVPAAPSGLNLIAKDTNFVSFSWNDNSDNESVFRIQRTTEDDKVFSNIKVLSSDVTTYTDSTVQPGNIYLYRVRAYNTNGASRPSDTLRVVIPKIEIEIDSTPVSPSDLKTIGVRYNAAFLSWNDNSNNEDGFRLMRRREDASDFSVLALLDADVTVYSDTINIRPSTSYSYKIQSYNDIGNSDFSNIISIQTLASPDTAIPSAPSSLKLEDVKPKSISINWEDNSDNESGFIVKRAAFPDLQYNDIDTTSDNTTFYTDNSILSEYTYLYKISAINKLGQSISKEELRVSSPGLNDSLRISDSLIVSYNFSNVYGSIVLDKSGYKNPLDLIFEDPNNSRKNSQSTVELDSETTLKSKDFATKIVNACKLTNEITVECWIKTRNYQLSQPAKILTIENDNSQVFSLNCYLDFSDIDKTRYGTNILTTTTDDYGNPSFDIEKYLDTEVLQHIVFTHDREGTEKIFINNQEFATAYRPADYANWEGDYYLYFGNNLSKNAPWFGDLYYCSFYNVALTSSEIETNYLASPFSNMNYVMNSSSYTISSSPNPANEKISFSIKSQDELAEISEKYFVRIINQNGNTILEKNITSFIDKGNFEMETSEIHSGIYTLVLFNEHQIISHCKIVIIHQQ